MISKILSTWQFLPGESDNSVPSNMIIRLGSDVACCRFGDYHIIKIWHLLENDWFHHQKESFVISRDNRLKGKKGLQGRSFCSQNHEITRAGIQQANGGHLVIYSGPWCCWCFKSQRHHVESDSLSETWLLWTAICTKWFQFYEN